MSSLRSSALPYVFLLLLFPASSAETKSSASSARSAGGRGLIGVRLNAKTRSIDLGSVSNYRSGLSLFWGRTGLRLLQVANLYSPLLKEKVGREREGEREEECGMRKECRSVVVDLYLVYLSLRLIPALTFRAPPNVKVVNFRHSWVIAVRSPVSHLSLPREKCRRCRVQISFGRCRAKHALVNKLGDLTRASSPPSPSASFLSESATPLRHCRFHFLNC